MLIGGKYWRESKQTIIDLFFLSQGKFCMICLCISKEILHDLPLYLKGNSVWFVSLSQGKFWMISLFRLYLKGNSVWFVSITQRKFCMICLYISKEILYDLPLYLKGNSVWFVSLSQGKFCSALWMQFWGRYTWENEYILQIIYI